jgi:glycosyltransferase involved in cell wall biosynthesis
MDAGLLLAPAVGVLVPDRSSCTALLRAGVSGVPVHVVDPSDAGSVASAVEAAYASDLGAHWAVGAARAGGSPDGAAVEQRPRWAARGTRGPLLASDVTVYRSTPFMSGIQRTVARLHHALTDALRDAGGALLPAQLGATPEGTAHPDIRSDEVLSAATADLRQVDWLLGLDLDSQLAGGTAALQDARARGVGVAVNVFDLIPHTHPQWFPPGAAATSFTPWLQAVTTVADVLLVNSRATARELEAYLRVSPPRRPDSVRVHHLPLGCDFDEASDVEVGAREDAHFLMVGTVEPRKGHAAVLDAFERLWEAGHDVRLTVVGRSGWLVDDVVRRMHALQESRPFTWLQNASDAELDRLYRTCTAAIVASEGEGFGLPVVEAALRSCPVLVHDIPVLREIAGDGATYFSPTAPLEQVLQRAVAGRPIALVPQSGLLTWREVGDRLLRVLDGAAEPLATWSPEHGWTWR